MSTGAGLYKGPLPRAAEGAPCAQPQQAAVTLPTKCVVQVGQQQLHSQAAGEASYVGRGDGGATDCEGEDLAHIQPADGAKRHLPAMCHMGGEV